MRRYAIFSCTLVIFLCTNAQSQDTAVQEKENIIKKGYDTTADILKLVYQKNNVIISPFNIRLALALVHEGADGNTRDEIANLLGLPTDPAKIQQAHEILSQILREIENTTEVPVYTGDEGWKDVKGSNINNANGIFVQEGIQLNRSYKSLVQSLYKGEAINVDFAKQTAKATDTINEFVSKNTNGRIPKLFPTPVDSADLIVIAACLYFKAGWEHEFSKYSTKEGTFNTGSSKTSVKFMQQRERVPYIDIPSLQVEAAGLSYTGHDTSMFVVLPYENQTLDAVVSSLNGDVLKRIAQKSSTTLLDLKIPQTKYKWSEDLNDSLQKLGVKDMFTSKAKLTNIANVALSVSQVTHAAEIEINEKGTEASAVTVIQMIPLSGHFGPEPIPKPFYVDRPFLLFIYHHKTETILFIGTVHNPTGSS